MAEIIIANKTTPHYIQQKHSEKGKVVKKGDKSCFRNVKCKGKQKLKVVRIGKNTWFL